MVLSKQLRRAVTKQNTGGLAAQAKVTGQTTDLKEPGSQQLYHFCRLNNLARNDTVCIQTMFSMLV